MKQTILAALAAWATLVIGCASTNVIVSSPTVTPITHRPDDGSVQRSVGLLRRLAVLPLQLDVTPQNPKRCAGPCDWEELRSGLAHNVVDYLATWRGYEVVTLDPLVPSRLAVDLTVGELEERVGRLTTFADQRSSDPPSEELAEMVRDLGTRTGVDGIVILHGKTTTLSWMEVAAAFPLALSGYGLLAAIPVEMARLGTRLEADIFEVATGRLVWTSVFSAGVDPLSSKPGRPTAFDANAIVTKLFDPIEPALPAALTRPSTGLQ
jgi:hypothetical protein